MYTQLSRFAGSLGMNSLARSFGTLQAIHELNALSNRELAELGISRGEIRYVAKNGRYIDNADVTATTVTANRSSDVVDAIGYENELQGVLADDSLPQDARQLAA